MSTKIQKVFRGRDSLSKVPQMMEKLQMSRPLIIGGDTLTGKLIRKNPGLMTAALFSGYHPNPDLDDAMAGVTAFQHQECDGLISIGGGSAMDTAKAVQAILAAGSLEAVNKGQIPEQMTVPHLAIPGTAGSGSEATPNAVVYAENRKMSLASPGLTPDGVILDASLLDSLPMYHKKSCALDALCQGIESFWCRSATDDSRVHAYLAILGVLDNLKAYDYTLGLYTDEGFLYEVGDTIKNPDLADTLEMLAKDGIKGFYDSEFTDKMVSHIQSLGGVLTHEDFAQYKSVMRDPLSTTYNGYTVYTTGGPSNGGVALLEALNILAHFDLKSCGFDSPETVQIMADASAMAYQDGVSFMGDPDYYDLPVETIISKEYAEERAKAITPGERIKTAKAGRLTVTLSETGQKVLDDCTPDQGGTTHLVCADKFGNVVSTTNTNGINFGSAVAVPGTGFVFSAHLGNLNNSTSARVNMVMPYIRVRSTTCPTIVAGPDGKPVLAIGSPGNWALVSAAIEGVVNYATFGMGLGNVINSPRSYRDGISKNLTIEAGYSEETIKKLEEMGFVLEDYDKDFSSHVGSLAGIQINSDGSFWALGDFRRNYGASAY